MSARAKNRALAEPLQFNRRKETEMRKLPISRGERRRMHALKAQFQAESREAEGRAYQRGFSAGDADGFKRGTAAMVDANGKAHARGVKEGGETMRAAVLDHAGRLYKERKDSDAAAVREVHRLLPTTV